MNRFRLIFLSFVVLLMAVPILWSVGAAENPNEVPNEVQFYLSLVEFKGSTSTESLAAPEIDPATLSTGYTYKGPGDFDASAPDKWQVSAYAFSDSSLAVRQGDKVKLTIFGVNGDLHIVRVESPSGKSVVDALQMNRGREYTIEFEAEEAGYYRLLCATDAPTMTANILAVPAQ